MNTVFTILGMAFDCAAFVGGLTCMMSLLWLLVRIFSHGYLGIIHGGGSLH